jgi:hypothetical protein
MTPSSHKPVNPNESRRLKLPRRSNKLRSSPRQSGYALLLIMFLLTIMILLSMPLAQRVITDGRRDREQEMIWRGNQYARGVKLFYMKNHRFPTSMDDLVKPKIGVRFMRQAYKDPMNKEDGSWRLIYVGASGQLIGSLKPHPLTLQMGSFGGAPAPPGAANSNQNGLLSQSGLQGSNATSSNPNQPGTSSAPGQTGTSATPGQPGTNAAAGGQDNQEGAPGGLNGNAASATDSATTAEGITIMGGNIIGVGSKINKKSILWYDKARNYRQFEFIWDPAKEAAAFLGQQGNSPAGTTPLGTSPLTSQPGQNSPAGFGNSGFGNSPGGSGSGGFGNQPQNPPANPPATPPLSPNPPPPTEQ